MKQKVQRARKSYPESDKRREQKGDAWKCKKGNKRIGMKHKGNIRKKMQRRMEGKGVIMERREKRKNERKER